MRTFDFAMYSRRSLSHVLLLAALVVGCDAIGPSVPESVEVKGTVTLDGNPLAGARVIFVPTGTGCCVRDGLPPVSSGITDAEGIFELRQTDGTPGAATGLNQVLVSKPLPAIQPSGYEHATLDMRTLVSNDQALVQITRTDTPQPILPAFLRTAQGFQARVDEVPRCYQQPGFLRYDIMPIPGIARPRIELTSIDPLPKIVTE